MTKNEAVQKVLNLARSEIGYHEKNSNASLDSKTANSGSGNYTKYGSELDALTNWYNGAKNGYAWCDVFVDWLFYKCFGASLAMQMICQPAKSAGASCYYSAQYYKNANRFYTTNPQPGDQIFFSYSAGDYSHTGIIESVNGITITTIEGNTTDQVGRRTYVTTNSTIAGYGRPKWELVTISETNTASSEQIDTTYEVLKFGSRGENVLKLQKKLIELGYNLGTAGADGQFGSVTLDGVKKFQEDYNLFVDGVVGKATWDALNKASKKDNNMNPSTSSSTSSVNQNDSNSLPSSLNLPVIKEDAKGVEVMLAQSALGCWGYSVVVHGIFGIEMTEKVRDFQKKKNLMVDGIIGKETWKALLKY